MSDEVRTDGIAVEDFFNPTGHTAVAAKDFLVVQAEGNRQVKRSLNHYNLDAIIRWLSR